MIKIQRRGWQETFTYREAVVFLKSLSSESLTEYWVIYDGNEQNGFQFLSNYQETAIITEEKNQLFQIKQNEEGALFLENNEISIALNRTQFQKILLKEYAHKLPINVSKAVQYYQNQLF